MPQALRRPHPPRPSSLAVTCLLLLACFRPVFSQVVAVGSLGAASGDHFKGARFAYAAGLFLKFDEMVLIGAQGGQGSVGGDKSVPITSSAMVRLPIGRIVLPIATGDVGYAIVENPGFFWRGGGGFDIRNGRRSSFLLLGGVEGQGQAQGWYARGGLLLEF
jgi:hypothetical protein